MWPLMRSGLITLILLINYGLSAPECTGPEGGPVHVTAECIDAEWNTVVIDTETSETHPVAHHKVSGHFTNTNVTVNIYLPPKDQWQGRFFHMVYPTQLADATDTDIGFAIDSGAFFVRITGTLGYRADAAAAKFARKFALDYYEANDYIYGYIYGGSGGSFQTIGAMENTEGVWDGGVPFIPGTPVMIPIPYSVRALGGLVLRPKAAEIIDAVRPGGSQDPSSALNSLQKSIWREVTTMGVPIRSWEDFERVGGTDNLRQLNESFRGLDPTYKEDFWMLPGYEGTEQSELGDIFRAALVNYSTTIEQVVSSEAGSPISIVLSALPPIAEPLGLDFTIYDTDVELGIVWGDLDVDSKTLSLYDASNATAVSSLTAGLTVTVDNKYFLALHAYHRHQIPTFPGFHNFDQFLDAEGQPLYPQRDVIVSEVLSRSSAGGGTHNGNISGKVIVVSNLIDDDAWPYNADWYRTRVQEALGAAFGDMFRLFFNDNANHNDSEAMPAQQASRLVPFTGLLQYALRELASWVEGEALPAQSTNYTMDHWQVYVDDAASTRHGIQPVAILMVNGAVTADVVQGDLVTFEAHIETPEGSSKIVAVEWDFIGAGDLVLHPIASPASSLDLEVQMRYNETGTYFPAIRVTSQREGDPLSAFARAMNLGRARVVVS